MAHAIVEAGLPALAGDPLELDPYGHQRFAHVARLHEIAFRVVLEEVVEYEVDGE